MLFVDLVEQIRSDLHGEVVFLGERAKRAGHSAASSFFCERHIKPERFQNLDRSNSDVLLVITHKRIVPNNHFATVVAAIVDRGAGVSDPGYRMSREPTIEAFTRVTRQGTSRGETEGFFHQQP